MVFTAAVLFVYFRKATRDELPFNVVPLTSYKGIQAYPSFSPDGGRIAFSWNGEKQDNIDIYVMAIASGTMRRFTTDPASDGSPVWSPDGEWIYFGSNRSGKNQVWKSSPAGENLQQVTRDGGLEAFESPDGKTLYYTKGNYSTQGLWSMPVQGGAEIAIRELSQVYPGHWGIADRGIYFVDYSDAPPGTAASIKIYDFRTQSTARVSSLSKIDFLNHAKFSVTHDGRWIVWQQRDRTESTLMLIDNFR